MRALTNLLMALSLSTWILLFGLYANGFYRLYILGWPLRIPAARLALTIIGFLFALVAPIWLRRKHLVSAATVAAGLSLIVAVMATVLSFAIASSAL